MPRGDGTGPPPGGTGGGRGAGGGRGGRMGGPFSAGPEGYCVCPGCGNKVLHRRGQPCNQMPCPNCGTIMTRG